MLDELAVLPWPAGLVVGVLGDLFIRHGIPAWASGQPGPLAQAFGTPDAFAPLAWIVLAACAMASLFSWLDARRLRTAGGRSLPPPGLRRGGKRPGRQIIAAALARHTARWSGLGWRLALMPAPPQPTLDAPVQPGLF